MLESMPGPFKALLAGWKRFAHALGWVNSRILLTLLYIILIGPYAVLRRIGRLISSSSSPSASFWLEKVYEPPTIEVLRRMF